MRNIRAATKSPRGALARAATWQALRRSSAIALCCMSLGLPACTKTYYTLLEQVGVEKRDLLSKRVTRAKESQEEAQKEFRDALEKFQAVTGQHGGELEERYHELRDAYERSKEQAHEVSDRIDSVQQVADDLLAEWNDELDRYQDQGLRRRSQQELAETRGAVRRLLTAMHRAERSLDPVLRRLQDRVLYLKHNLNASVLSGLDAQMPELQADVARLVREMQDSIEEADRFIARENDAHEG
jgi:hypothetical protein